MTNRPNLFTVLRELQDASGVPWFCARPDWQIASANRAFQDLVGPGRRLVGARPPYTFWDAEDRDRLVATARARQATFGGPRDTELPVTVRALPVHASTKARPDAFVVQATLADGSRGADDTAMRDRLRRLEATLARVRFELERAAVTAPGPPSDPLAAESLKRLSARERQVVDALLRGERVAQVAETLGIAPNTVRNHVKAVFRKIGVRSQTELFVKLRFLMDGRTA